MSYNYLQDDEDFCSFEKFSRKAGQDNFQRLNKEESQRRRRTARKVREKVRKDAIAEIHSE